MANKIADFVLLHFGQVLLSHVTFSRKKNNNTKTQRIRSHPYLAESPTAESVPLATNANLQIFVILGFHMEMLAIILLIWPTKFFMLFLLGLHFAVIVCFSPFAKDALLRRI